MLFTPTRPIKQPEPGREPAENFGGSQRRQKRKGQTDRKCRRNCHLRGEV